VASPAGGTGFERATVRIVTVAVVAFSFVAPTWMNTPKKLPGVALDSTWILYVARATALLIALLLATTVVVRGVLRGQLPTSFSRDGIEWEKELVETTDDIAGGLQNQIDVLAAEIDDMREAG
jgi:hypothetical protein